MSERKYHRYCCATNAYCPHPATHVVFSRERDKMGWFACEEHLALHSHNAFRPLKEWLDEIFNGLEAREAIRRLNNLGE